MAVVVSHTKLDSSQVEIKKPKGSQYQNGGMV